MDTASVASVETISHEQLQSAAIVILHVKDTALWEQADAIRQQFSKVLTDVAGMEVPCIATNALERIEIASKPKE